MTRARRLRAMAARSFALEKMVRSSLSILPKTAQLLGFGWKGGGVATDYAIGGILFDQFDLKGAWIQDIVRLVAFFIEERLELI